MATNELTSALGAEVIFAVVFFPVSGYVMATGALDFYGY
jgi:hypothetical protein